VLENYHVGIVLQQLVKPKAVAYTTPEGVCGRTGLGGFEP
jgi:hypothetical protein